MCSPVVPDAPFDGYLGSLSEEQAAVEEARWAADEIDWGMPEEWEEGRDGFLLPPARFAFDGRFVRPQPTVVLHNDVTRMLEFAAGGARSPIGRRGFTWPEDFRAVVLASASSAGYAFECLGKAVLLAAHFTTHGSLPETKDLKEAASRQGGRISGHNLLALFATLRREYPTCVAELHAALGDPFTLAAAGLVDAFIARLRYFWVDEVRGAPSFVGFDTYLMELQSVYVSGRVSGSGTGGTAADGMANLDGLLSEFADALIKIYFALTAGLWRATRPLPYFPSATLLANASKAFPAETEFLLGVVLDDDAPGWQVRSLAAGGHWGHFDSAAPPAESTS